ncbi:MAG: thiamine-phosphate kinase [Phycisphaeraceae bacterium]|nr:thiamine-phosphate kinase [Phycisphaeraceae bacterium]
MREMDLLAHIASRSADLGSFPGVVVGPGDDCAVVRTGSGDLLLLTTDHLVLGRHIAPDAPVEAIARKAIARSVSDIGAMAGRARWGLGTGALPKGYGSGDALFDAMARWARHWGCPLVGGDVSGVEGPLMLTVMVVGEPHRTRGPVLRSGARPGDGVYVTGRIGGSLASGRHATFEPRVVEGAWLADVLGERLHAMMDISDGLGIDAGRLGAASGVRVEIDGDAVPLHEGAGPVERAIADGEDYELLFAAEGDVPRACETAGTAITRIGRVTEGTGCVLVVEGREREILGEGWEH